MNKFKSLILLTTLVLFSTIAKATNFIVINDRQDPISIFFIEKSSVKKFLKLQKGEIKDYIYKQPLLDDEAINKIDYIIENSKSSTKDFPTFRKNYESYFFNDTIIIRFFPNKSAPTIALLREMPKKANQLITELKEIKLSTKKANKTKKRSEIMDTFKLIRKFNEKYSKILNGNVKFTFTKEKLNKKLKDKFNEKTRTEDLEERITFLSKQ